MKSLYWIEAWKITLQESKFRFIFVSTLLLLILSATIFTNFLDFVEMRPGAVLSDPILGLFIPKDVTWITFSLIYLSIILALIHLIQYPRQLIVAVQAYIILVFARMISMYVIPLNPPAHLIPLEDPFVQSMSSGLLTKDLFFSGHTSTLFLLYLSSKNKNVKVFFLLATIIVGICVLWQHVHYSIDVIAAPFYAYTCYRASVLLNQKLLGFESKGKGKKVKVIR